MSDKIDQSIRDLFEHISKSKKEIEAIEKHKKRWLTNASLTLPNQVIVNLQTAPAEVIKSSLIALLQYKDYDNKASLLLDMEPVDNYHGYSYDDWITDCKKRISDIALRTKKDNLSKLEKRLDGIVSPEQRRAMELEAIKKELGV